MIVTTVGTVEGYHVGRYYPPVTATCVAGAGWPSGISAGFTDVFGGRSEPLEQHLEAMYAEVIGEIQAAASRTGANGLVGLRFDFDSLAGTGSTLFMLNAVGTPVELLTDQEWAEQSERVATEQLAARRLDDERRERVAAATDRLSALLQEPGLGDEARKLRRIYGRNVCAEYLTRRAHELGLADVAFTEEDIPEEF